jgi:ATPase involved in DNA replication initiation
MTQPRKPAKQIALPLDNRPRFGREDYMVGEANRLAFDWCERWPGWTGPVTAIVGPSGSGKTHLLTIWQQRTGAETLKFSDLNDGLVARLDDKARCFTLDDAEAVAGDPVREEALFHLFNHLKGIGGSLLLTAGREPSRWGLDLPDLASRLKSSTVVSVMPPDDPMMAALMVKHFADRQLDVEQAVIDYLLTRMDRSYAAIRDLVLALDRVSLAERRRITIPLARDILASHHGGEASDKRLD